ncbi:hypothetical protein PtA15_8A624 [Puccinia triticina]|uniref:Uncharacterized protein n=1 Tax=Puccinia triticina TaxID=208348 RepID=A0ABY7CTP0_9BASI|nr:uncharacterized protein PtA15_8A624 [Puccinia triticina]WAQ87718.1 hypothetical protein PtA15_8A624 [Puccinia triticina]
MAQPRQSLGSGCSSGLTQRGGYPAMSHHDVPANSYLPMKLARRESPDSETAHGLIADHPRPVLCAPMGGPCAAHGNSVEATERVCTPGAIRLADS